jgi:hypothetical protein
MALTLIDCVIMAALFCGCWKLAALAGWWVEILRILLVAVAAGGAIIYFIEHA